MSGANVHSGLVPIPAHVPPNLVFDFDYETDAALLRDPHARLAELVEQAPAIFFTPRNGGQWVFIGYKALFEATRTPDLFSSRPSLMPNGEMSPTLLPLMVDPPEHGHYRAPLNTAFSPRSMKALEGDIRTLARELIDAVIDSGKCDFLKAIAEPLPVSVFLRLMGLPQERMVEFRDAIRTLQEPTSDGAEIYAIAGIMEPFIQTRREQPEDDLISRLWALQIEGRPISIDEMRNYCILLFIAGLDTVINAISFTVRHLAGDLALQSKLRADPALIPVAVEEMLRKYGIVTTPRKITRDQDFQGVSLRAGDRVQLVLAAGNLDPAGFANPKQFDLGRETVSHLTFNAGPHRCVGAHLARIEMHVICEEVLSRMPEFRLDPDSPARFHSGGIIGVDTLGILWEPKAKI